MEAASRPKFEPLADLPVEEPLALEVPPAPVPAASVSKSANPASDEDLLSHGATDCRDRYVGQMAGAPQIVADLLQRPRPAALGQIRKSSMGFLSALARCQPLPAFMVW